MITKSVTTWVILLQLCSFPYFIHCAEMSDFRDISAQ